MKRLALQKSQSGFTMIEVLIACIMFPLIVVGVAQAFDAVRQSYMTSRQLNEIYAVLSACPEIDRALDFTYVASTTNCSPNNTFVAEGGSGTTYSYTPTLTVTDATSLPASDELQPIPDSKVVEISVGYIKSSAPDLKLRMLITRNGIAQL